VEDPQLLAHVRDVLARCLADNTSAWELGADGAWRRVQRVGEARSAQLEMMDRATRTGQAPLNRPLP
jgi:polyphosphate kinase